MGSDEIREEKKYLRFCQKHGPQGEENIKCPKCGRETTLSDVTKEQLHAWTFSKDDKERGYAYDIGRAFKTDLDKILKDLRSGKKGKVTSAVELLTWRPEREAYIEEVIPWWQELPTGETALFLSRCSYEKVRPYLDFKNYHYTDENNIKLFWPIFLEHYKHQESLPCEDCKQEGSNLFIKIETKKEVLSAVRHVGYVVQQLEYTGHAAPHVFCNACAIKKADKKKSLRVLSDAEKIRAWMNFNTDANIKTCGDDPGDIGYSRELIHGTPGFNYEYLISEEAQNEMMRNTADQAVLAAMIECALNIKDELDAID